MPFNLAAAHRPAAAPSTNKSMISSGRGGAGNMQKHQLPPTSTLPASKTSPALPAQQRGPLSSIHANSSESSLDDAASTRSHETDRTTVSSWRNPFGASYTPTPPPQPPKSSFGRGGAGNSFPAWQCALFAFDEELERTGTQNVAPIYYIGRGGSGNRNR
jgi:Protein of unknown function (DUF3602)